MAVMFEDRLLLLMMAFYVSLLLGGPPSFHTLLGLDRPGRALRQLAATVGARMNRAQRPVATRRARGIIVLTCVILLGIGVGLAVHQMQYAGRWGFVLEVILLASLLPLRPPLDVTGEAVRLLKTRSLPDAARRAGLFLRRDQQGVDVHGFCRACIAYLAHSLLLMAVTSFWYLLAGLPAALAAALTMRLVDRLEPADPQGMAVNLWPRRVAGLLSWIPGRLAGLLLLLAAPLVPGSRPGRGMAALASEKGSVLERLISGILGVALGGGRRWQGQTLDEPWIGEAGTAKATAADVTRARILAAVAGGLLLLLVTALNL